ncbi:MAG: zinc ABC transporter substrate-binding protein [Chloroflexi bacterium]|nr:zinc ABC transporter substrate-binding protein [Chloroflexota bacterium]MBP8057582.1 zinc ABC transporter substrate-binding protein [Chloroflexota bacterium]
MKKKGNHFGGVLSWLIGILLITSCSSGGEGQATGRVQVVATTTLVGDVVRIVGGDHIDLTVMLPVGGDPHGFNPTPRDVTTAAAAAVVFINGLELEAFMAEMLENAATTMNIVELSADLEAMPLLEEPGDEAEHGDEEEHEHGEFDPHVWWNPLNVVVWTEVVAAELARLDPENGAVYAANAAAYQQQLRDLDNWIKEQVAQIPEARRILVTDHDSLGYFVNTYGFSLVGTVFPGLSTQTEPSAQELASLINAIREQGVPAVFVGTTVNTELAAQVATETGVQVIAIYTDSLSQADEPATTYLEFMRWNVTQIVSALR